MSEPELDKAIGLLMEMKRVGCIVEHFNLVIHTTYETRPPQVTGKFTITINGDFND